MNSEEVLDAYRSIMREQIYKRVDNPLKQFALLLYTEGTLSHRELLEITYEDLLLGENSVITQWMGWMDRDPHRDLSDSTRALMQKYYEEAEVKEALVFLNTSTLKPYSTSWYRRDLSRVRDYTRLHLLDRHGVDVGAY